MERIKKHIDTIVDSFKIPMDKIIGVGFSLPGTVDEEKLLLVNAPNLRFKNIDFKKYETIYNYKFYLENEANAAAYAETFFNFNNVVKNLVFVSITEGIGAGIMIKDNLYAVINVLVSLDTTIVKNGEQCNCVKRMLGNVRFRKL
jgi:predicted NBD/HSP70 family sugar kinase